MGEIINTNTAIETQPGGDTGALLDITQSLLADASTALNSSGVLSVPIAELSTLGAGISSLIPALNTVTQTTSIAADGLYTIANAGVGDVLKAAKNGNFWASLKTADGASKMVQLQEAGAITATTQTAAAFNPATMMMAVALFSIEQELGEIEDMQRQIISFLEIEKESEIEADVESLMSIIKKYKDNWDNERFVSGNHNQVLTYQNRARKNMLGYPTNQSNSSKRSFLHVIIDTPIKSAARLPTGCQRLHHKATHKRAKLTKQKTPRQNLYCLTLPISALPEWGQLICTKSLPISDHHSEQVLVVVLM